MVAFQSFEICVDVCLVRCKGVADTTSSMSSATPTSSQFVVGHATTTQVVAGQQGFEQKKRATNVTTQVPDHELLKLNYTGFRNTLTMRKL
eukprot:3391458-Amphidinium_carterae.1